VAHVRVEGIYHVSASMLDTVLAGLNVDRELRDAITGDLLEERAALAAVHGERRANHWMRLQIVLSAFAFGRAAVHDGGFRLLAAIAGAAFAALLAVGVLIGATAAVVSALLSPETIGRLTIVVFAIDLAFGTAGGYLAARLGRAAPLGAAFVFGILGVSLALIWGGEASGWYRMALPFLLLPATVAGGWLRARHLARAHPA
jgi:hypothetical protein